jgi:hypothetical protein
MSPRDIGSLRCLGLPGGVGFIRGLPPVADPSLGDSQRQLAVTVQSCRYCDHHFCGRVASDKIVFPLLFALFLLTIGGGYRSHMILIRDDTWLCGSRLASAK